MPDNNEQSWSDGRRKTSTIEEPDDDYLKKREKNNLAVRKSRTKSRQKAEETHKRVEGLKVENAKLEAQIQIHKKQLAGLKDILLKHATSGNVPVDINFEELLRDSD